MDFKESQEYNFIFNMNKCILLFNYIDIYYQKEILSDIKYFISRLGNIFENKKFNSVQEKKENILNIFNKYLLKIINEKIIFLIEDKSENFITEINNIILKTCNEIYKKKEIENKYNINKKISTHLDKSEQIIKEGIKESIGIANTKEDYNENQKIYLKEFEKKVDNKIKTIFVDIENNIKLSLKDYIEHTIHIKNDIDRKNDIQIKSINTLIDNKISSILDTLFDDEQLNKKISNNVKNEMNELYSYIDNIYINLDSKINNVSKIYDDNVNKLNNALEIINNELNINIDTKVNNIDIKVNNINETFNAQLENILKKICNLLIEKNNDLYNFFDSKINNEKNNYQLFFDKDENIVKLLYNNDELSSTKINIKGLMGPKGLQGNTGDKGDTPIIRKILLTDDKKIKFIIQDTQNIYEIISDETIPLGPQGIQGERGPSGKTFLELHWKQENVMKLDTDNENNLIILKSLSIGEKSHCLKENSLAIGSSSCYNDNSFAIGNSKTLDNNSIALYGTTIGKNAFSYRSENVDENCIVFGKTDKNIYNIEKFDINSKEINLECDVLNIKAKNIYINKIKELEEKIINMEKKINDFIKKR
jgi:hypothetical protein